MYSGYSSDDFLWFVCNVFDWNISVTRHKHLTVWTSQCATTAKVSAVLVSRGQYTLRRKRCGVDIECSLIVVPGVCSLLSAVRVHSRMRRTPRHSRPVCAEAAASHCLCTCSFLVKFALLGVSYIALYISEEYLYNHFS